MVGEVAVHARGCKQNKEELERLSKRDAENIRWGGRGCYEGAMKA